MSRDAKRDLTAGIVLCIVALVWAFVAAPARAQQLDPLAPVQAYTTDHPNPEGAELGLATPDGRFAITPMQGCDWLAAGQTIYVYPNWQLPPWLGVSGTDAVAPGCIVRVDGRMSSTPCFANTDGMCDESQERD